MSHAPASDVVFQNVRVDSARELLLSACRGSFVEREGHELDTYHVEYELSDQDVIKWLNMVMVGYKLSTTTEYHDDGTVTHYPCIRE